MDPRLGLPETNMKNLALGALILAAVSSVVPAGATTINITESLPLGSASVLVNDVSAQGIPGSGLGDATVLAWLKLDIATYNSNVPGTLPAPSLALTAYDNLTSGPSIPVSAGDYLVLHYGKGPGGLGKGGGLVALYFDANGTYVVPDNGSGPNGKGGISFARLWDHVDPVPINPVPDGGATLVLLGMALSGLGLVAHRIRN